MSVNPNSMLKVEYIKPVLAGAIATVLDRMVLKNEESMSNITFGVAVGSGTFISGMIGTKVTDILMPNDTVVYTFSGKTLIQRAIEITCASGVSYGANKYLFANDFNQSNMYRRVAVIALSEFIAEYATDVASGNAIGYFV
jgi:hypothetical protein